MTDDKVHIYARCAYCKCKTECNEKDCEKAKERYEKLISRKHVVQAKNS